MGYVFGGAVPRRFPLVTAALIVVNAVVYIATSRFTGLASASSEYIYRYGYVPALLLSYEGVARIFTSMFLHADLLHLLFNMYFLYVFGRGVEDLTGSRRFLLLYLASGVGAALFHTASVPVSGLEALAIPAVGASGAISGVLGAYLMLFPGTSLVACFPVLLLPLCFTVRASAYLVFWFALQVVYGYMRIGGIAFFAHAGGFVTGILMVWILGRSRVAELRLFRWSLPFGYIVFRGYREGLGRFTKSVLVLLMVLMAASLFYYSAETDVARVTVYSGDVSVDGYADVMLLKVLPDGSYSYGGATSAVANILLLRLHKMGLLVNPDLAGRSLDSHQTPIEGEVEIRIEAYGISRRVPVVLFIRATYDERGVALSLEGLMRTRVVEVTVVQGRAVVREVPADYDFSMTLTGPYAGDSVTVTIPPSIVLSLASAYVVARRDAELSVS